MFVANKALDVGEQCLPFAAVIGAGGRGKVGMMMKMKERKYAL